MAQTDMSKQRNIVFFGTEDFSLTALSGLIENNYNVRLVVTKPDAPRGRGHKLASPAVKLLAEKHNITALQPRALGDIRSVVEELDQPVGVLSSYGKIVPEAILNLFTPGIINIHPSLLPLYRGPSPIESAILNNDTKTGVSIMKLVAAMDAGPVYVQAEIELTGTETKPELYKRLAKLGTELLIDHLPSIMDGSLLPQPQNDQAASYCPLLSKADGILDPARLTAEEAERRVRAYAGYPKTRFNYGQTSLIVTKAHISHQAKTPLDMRYRDGAYLVIDELVAPSGRTMSAEAFLRGYAS